MRKARKKVLYRADKELRERFEQLDSLKLLAEFFNIPTKRVNLSSPLESEIRLRNRIAHDLPDDLGWWAEAARVLNLNWIQSTKQRNLKEASRSQH